ncbi:MAG: hypothetical protein LBI28_06495 [Treponema sp.]|nr:hypothetical protein [Treponema sp.]
MKKTGAFFTFIALIITIALLSGCVGFSTWNPVTIKIDGNLATIVAGETLNFRASGQYIIWEVSSSSDGSQPAADGTFITQRGLLTAAIDEDALFLYVTATSAKNGRSDTKRIRVVTVDAVNIIPAHQSVELGRSTQFVARVEGYNYPEHTVIWRVSSNASGTGAVAFGTNINENGLLRVASNERATVLYVFATSIIDLRVSGSTFITVSPVYVSRHYSSSTFFFFAAPHTRPPANRPHPNPPVNHPNDRPHPNPPANTPNDRPHPNPPANHPNDRPHSNPPVNTPNDRPHSNPPANHPNDRPHSNPPVNTPNDRPHSNPPVNAPNDRPHSNPPVNAPNDRPHSNPPANTPNDRPHSNPPVNAPNDRPHPNPPVNAPNDRPRSEPSANTQDNRPRSNPQVNTPSNNSRPTPPANTPSNNNPYLEPPETTPTPSPAPPRETPSGRQSRR